MSELPYQIALTLLPQIGDVQARLLLQHLGSASAIFREKKSHLEKIEGIGAVRAASIKSFRDFSLAESEAAFVEKFRIEPLFFTDSNYPARLLHCYDAPVLLYYKGSANLNASRIAAIVGTRTATSYGRQSTEQLVEALAAEEVIIVSGLALGIDAAAHRAALQWGAPTVGVVGHGLDQVYPYTHKALARDMIAKGGGLLTEFTSGTKPDRHHFPLRNRIVAALSDVTIVMETSIKGGSMITAKMADAYNRDVFALPGRTTDSKSSGCNYLIQHNKAMLLSDADALLQVMGWKKEQHQAKKQRALFPELTADEQKLMALLQEGNPVPIDELNLRSGLSASSVAAALLNLELQGIVKTMPGKQYGLV